MCFGASSTCYEMSGLRLFVSGPIAVHRLRGRPAHRAHGALRECRSAQLPAGAHVRDVRPPRHTHLLPMRHALLQLLRAETALAGKCLTATRALQAPRGPSCCRCNARGRSAATVEQPSYSAAVDAPGAACCEASRLICQLPCAFRAVTRCTGRWCCRPVPWWSGWGGAS